ncbi:MAG: low molecular weight protein-tyrosine-phosphatase [Pseudomonadota bacterium]
MEKIHVLFVCMGNICRSPTAHGVFEKKVREAGLADVVQVDSAGTHAYHAGEPPDRRAQGTALNRGVDLSKYRARAVRPADFNEFHYVLAMDNENYQHLARLTTPETSAKLKLFLEFAPHLHERDVPDPYYGGASGFERVFDMVEAASEGLLRDLRTRYKV